MAAKTYWRSYAPAWIFPVFYVFGDLVAEKNGRALLFTWVVATPLFIWSFHRSTLPWRHGKVSYWNYIFWAILVPVIIWVFAGMILLLFRSLSG
jgi:hypothetical protein